MAQDYNLVGTSVVQQPHKILPMLVRHHYSLFRSSCSANHTVESAIRRKDITVNHDSQQTGYHFGSEIREERCSQGLGESWDETSGCAMASCRWRTCAPVGIGSEDSGVAYAAGPQQEQGQGISIRRASGGGGVPTSSSCYGPMPASVRFGGVELEQCGVGFGNLWRVRLLKPSD